MKKFDVQSTVRVKLNMLGIQILKKAHDEMCAKNEMLKNYLGDFKLPKVDGEGYTEFELAELMEIFGPYIKIGEDFPFDREIQIDERKLTNVIKNKK